VKIFSGGLFNDILFHPLWVEVNCGVGEGVGVMFVVGVGLGCVVGEGVVEEQSLGVAVDDVGREA